MEYEISPRYAAGLRKNFFETQRKSTPNIESQIKSLLSYSGFKFKDHRAFMAYYTRTIKQLSSQALFAFKGQLGEGKGTSDNKNPTAIPGSSIILLCIATPKAKQLINSNNEEYTEEYLLLEYFDVSVIPNLGLCFRTRKHTQHCEISSHTIERVLQRRKTTKNDNIIQEIRSSAIASLLIFEALNHIQENRWPLRIVIPSGTGAFLAEIDSSTNTLLYRTFVKDEMFDFQEASVDTTRSWVQNRQGSMDVTKIQADELFNHKTNRWWFDKSKEQHLSYRNVVSMT